MRSPLALALAFATSACVARAADHPIRGGLLRMKDARSASARRFRFRVGGEAGIVPRAVSDPRLAGATLAIVGTGTGDGSSGDITLPAARWTALRGGGFRWLDGAATGGVRKVVFKPGLLAVAGGGRGWPYAIGQPQAGIEVRFTLGTDVYCTRFARFLENRTGHVLARDATAPAACTPTPRCADHIVDAGEECDDGNLLDGDGCSSTCLREDVPCGNGVLDPGEECDDGNRRSGDGCSPYCQLESPAGACAGVPGVPGTSLATVLVASSLSMPVYVTAPPLDPTRLFVVEQSGCIKVLKDGTLLPDPFLDVGREISCCGEQGLLGVAFHPDYERNGRFFVAYTNTGGDEVLARFQVSANPDVADATSEKILLTIPDFAANHNGGQLAFGPDGYLYWGDGDGGGGDDPMETGQDPSVLLGKLLRLDVDVDTPPYYAAPPSNPFVGPGDPRDEIWALGLRNPWRFSFDRVTGDLYIGDVGQNQWEEIDFQPATSPGGENYGWDVFEGDGHCHEPTPPAAMCPDPPVGFTMPVLEYDHGQGCAVMGGFVYRGCALPDLRGTYFYADYCTAFIRSFRMSAGLAVDAADHTTELAPGHGLAIDNVSAFGEDARGELYVVDYDGEIFKIVPGS